MTSVRARRLSCPTCSTPLSWREVDLSSSFRCQACNQALEIPRSYSQCLCLLSVMLISLVAYAFGARQGILLSAVLVGFFPVHIVVVSLARILLPPNLRLSDDYSLDLSTRGRASHVIAGQAEKTGLLKRGKPS